MMLSDKLKQDLDFVNIAVNGLFTSASDEEKTHWGAIYNMRFAAVRAAVEELSADASAAVQTTVEDFQEPTSAEDGA